MNDIQLGYGKGKSIDIQEQLSAINDSLERLGDILTELIDYLKERDEK